MPLVKQPAGTPLWGRYAGLRQPRSGLYFDSGFLPKIRLLLPKPQQQTAPVGIAFAVFAG